MKDVVVIGAGLTGCLLALSLAKKNYRVSIYERREDVRYLKNIHGRSINLAISQRGLKGLEQVGLKEKAIALSVPVLGRMMHDLQARVTQHAYGRNTKEHNYSISRNALNCLLLDELTSLDNVSIYFKKNIIDYDLNHLYFASGEKIKVATVFATDGVNSAIRTSLEKKGLMQFQRTPYQHGYKEILLDSCHGASLSLEYLHIWPRDDFMLMALANNDESFTCTLFLANEQLATLDTSGAINKFFDDNFSDFSPLVPDLTTQFLTNPHGQLLTIKGGPWHYQDKVLLLGDAAHAMVPFLGQGMNCGFEDVSVFNELLNQYGDDWELLFDVFYQRRKENADAITKMAEDNYHEMSCDVASPNFLLKKSIEHELMRRYPDGYVSKYVLVSYTNEPYAFALKQGERQAKLLDKLADGINTVEELDWQRVDDLLREYTSR
jgi:kynurenine 3-monooxygenase